MLKETLAIEIYEKYKEKFYLIEGYWKQSDINNLKLSVILDKYCRPTPQPKIEHI